MYQPQQQQFYRQPYFCCNDPTCQNNYPPQMQQVQKSQLVKPVSYLRTLKKYYILALLIIAGIGLNEELTRADSYLKNNLRYYLDQPTTLEYFVGNAKSMGNIPQTVEECPNDISFKDFHMKYITGYQPCLFLYQISNWSAIQNWKQPNYLAAKIGQDTLIQVDSVKGGAKLGAQFIPEYKQEFMKYGEFVSQKLGVKKGKYSDQSYVIYDQRVPESLMEDIFEPKVTQQILKHQDTSIIQGIDIKTIAQYYQKDRMFCVAQGYFNVTLAPSWERLFIYAGLNVPPNFSPVDFNRPNLQQFPNFDVATKYYIDLEEGDCLYIPPYWWQQIESDPNKPSIAVSYWYEVSSDWLKLVFTGIEKGYI
eukprot:403337837